MYGTQQFGGQQVRPQQYGGTIGSYYPQQTSDPFTGMFSMMMPMIMMVMMLGILTPMLKGFTTK